MELHSEQECPMADLPAVETQLGIVVPRTLD